jgi:16S rRNA (cytosine967-C5)-methyltransferase
VKKDIRYLLWVSLYQLAFMKKAHHQVVMQTVEFAKQHKGVRVANFINAVLRRFIREQDGIPYPRDPARRLSIVRSFPEWLVLRWTARFGLEETEKLLTLLNEAPHFTLRVNLDLISREEVMDDLTADGIRTWKGKFLDSAVNVDRLGPVLNHCLFRERFVSVQDETSQLVALAVAPGEGERILDACAGLGTKTAQLAGSCPASTVVAMDTSARRLGAAGEGKNLLRGDALRSPFREGAFDAILLDAPCSSMGILRKHPEIKWRRSEEDIVSFGNYQLDLLKSLWDNLKSGGRLVYSVCSFEPEETVEVLERFREKREFLLENPLPAQCNKGYFLSLPQETGMDGFFIARLKKL